MRQSMSFSAGTENRDRGYKKTLYERSGVREYWIVDPAQQSIEARHKTPNIELPIEGAHDIILEN